LEALPPNLRLRDKSLRNPGREMPDGISRTIIFFFKRKEDPNEVTLVQILRS
jgi:hypothetical protein